jgi:hypothetical protein
MVTIERGCRDGVGIYYQRLGRRYKRVRCAISRWLARAALLAGDEGAAPLSQEDWDAQRLRAVRKNWVTALSAGLIVIIVAAGVLL